MIPRNLNFINLILLVLLGLAPCLLSAATIDDLQFTLINGGTEYSVSALDPNTIAGAVDIPATYNGKPVKVIADNAFTNCLSLATVTFAPNSQLTTIGKFAFVQCEALTGITLPESVSSIGTGAFQECTSLTAIDLSHTALTVIESQLFFRCNTLTSIVIPQGVTSIGRKAFEGCTALTSITLPDTLTTIGIWAFNDCTALTSIVIPEGVTSIGGWAFYNCKALTSIKLPSSLTSIEQWTFVSCTALTSIVIPQGITQIGDSAFSQCHDLASVIFLGPAPTLGTEVFLIAGRDVGGFTITVYETHEASYASWTTSYTFNVVPDPNAEPVILLVTTHYNPTSKTLGIITSNEASFGSLSLQHTASLGGTWTTLSTLAYIQATDSSSGAVTRSVTINPNTHSTGFYRLVSTD